MVQLGFMMHSEIAHLITLLNYNPIGCISLEIGCGLIYVINDLIVINSDLVVSFIM